MIREEWKVGLLRRLHLAKAMGGRGARHSEKGRGGGIALAAKNGGVNGRMGQ